MKYTLITKSGLTMTFYIKELAEMYQTIHGGVLLDADGPRSAVIPFPVKQRKAA